MRLRNAELGGTWQVNSYPGAEVDVPTSLYSISFIAYPFTKTFASQRELLAYKKHVIDTFGLRKRAITIQSVATLKYDESESLWQVETTSGERYSARFLIDASGVLANPHVHGIRVAGGQVIKCLVIVDDATHECLATITEHSIGGTHLTRIMDQVCSQRGRPAVIRTDNVLRTKANLFSDNRHPIRATREASKPHKRGIGHRS